jgi:hypothetical protein
MDMFVSIHTPCFKSGYAETDLDDIGLLIILWIPIAKLYNHRPNQVGKPPLDLLVYPLIVRLHNVIARPREHAYKSTISRASGDLKNLDEDSHLAPDLRS